MGSSLQLPSGRSTKPSSTKTAACSAWACPARLRGGLWHQRSRPGRHGLHRRGRHPRGAIFHPTAPPTVLSVPGGSVAARHQQSRPGLRSWPSPRDSTRSHSSFFYDNGRMIDIGTLGGRSTLHGRHERIGPDRRCIGCRRRAPASLPLQRWQDDRDRHHRTDSERRWTSTTVGRCWARTRRGLLTLRPGAFLYSDGQMHEVGDLGGGFTIPQHLNELGQVVGFSVQRRAGG